MSSEQQLAVTSAQQSGCAQATEIPLTGIAAEERVLIQQSDDVQLSLALEQTVAVPAAKQLSCNSSECVVPKTFADLMPLPRKERSKSRPRAKPPKFELTSNDHFDFLAEREKPKQSKKSKGAMVTNKKCSKPSIAGNVTNRKSTMSKPSGTHRRKKTRVVSANDDARCLYCQELYSMSGENWVQCSDCQNWAHYSCAGFDDNSVDFTCELCQS